MLATLFDPRLVYAGFTILAVIFVIYRSVKLIKRVRQISVEKRDQQRHGFAVIENQPADPDATSSPGDTERE